MYDDECPMCGGQREWVECDAIGCEDGVISVTAVVGEDSLWDDEDDYKVCEQCMGVGGWWECAMCIQRAARTKEQRRAASLAWPDNDIPADDIPGG